MPIQSSPNSLEKLNDSILGVFSNLPDSKRLDHAVRFLSTWNGSDKLLMVVQYVIKLIIPVLKFRANLRYRAGLDTSLKSVAADKLAKLSSVISDSRTLWRIWGLLPIFQWLISIERNPPPSRLLQTIERLQGFSMLVYYPLEHVYYFAAHGILPPRFTPSSELNNKIAIWSCRAWAAYVALQFWHLKEDYRLLRVQEDSLKKSGVDSPDPGSIAEQSSVISRRKAALWNELVVNMSYLPLTVHWSLEKGLFTNEVLVGLFGTMAGIFSVRSGWAASSLPTPTPSTN